MHLSEDLDLSKDQNHDVKRTSRIEHKNILRLDSTFKEAFKRATYTLCPETVLSLGESLEDLSTRARKIRTHRALVAASLKIELQRTFFHCTRTRTTGVDA